MKIILVLACIVGVSFGFTSCKKDSIKQTLSSKVAHQISKVIINELECGNSSLVEKDMKKMTDKFFKISTPVSEPVIQMASAVSSKSIVGDEALSAKVIICKSVAGVVMPQVVELLKTGKIEYWDCSLNRGGEVLTNLVYSGCEKL